VLVPEIRFTVRIPRDGERGFQGMVSAHSTGS
jgi:hypothetical protein